MSNEKASPILGKTMGTHEQRRIALTRVDLIKILSRFVDFVKNKEAKEFPGWIDGIFAEAEWDGAIVFDSQAKPGTRIQEVEG
jgi:hypothetical protein